MANVTIQPRVREPWVLENPLLGERFGARKMAGGMTVELVDSVIEPQSPPGVPSVTWELRYDVSRAALGTLIAGGTTTSTTTGDVAVITDPDIPAGVWVWLVITAATTLLNRPSEISIQMIGQAK